jgi:hypothetical protein
MVSYAKLHYDFPNHHPSVPLMNMSTLYSLHLVVVLLSQPMWLIADVHVSIFKVLYPPSDTAGTHAGISVHMTMSSLDICSWAVFLLKEFNQRMLAKKDHWQLYCHSEMQET